MEDSVQKIVNENPDSLKIGTPAKGGETKLYGNFNDKVAFKQKIDNAKEVLEYAQANLAVNI